MKLTAKKINGTHTYTARHAYTLLVACAPHATRIGAPYTRTDTHDGVKFEVRLFETSDANLYHIDALVGAGTSVALTDAHIRHAIALVRDVAREWLHSADAYRADVFNDFGLFVGRVYHAYSGDYAYTDVAGVTYDTPVRKLADAR